jgi:NAD(P)-dependent dehydrogenase (short-subunit alcohol dehydrogenase family)
MTRSAIVTASDSGIGKATALALARDGLDVGITWHSDEAGAQDTAGQVRAVGRRAEVRRLDLEQLPGAVDVVDELADALGGELWAFVSNAGGGGGGPFLDLPYEEIATPLTGKEDVDPTSVPRSGVPLGRVGGAHEMAAVIAFLCREEASYVAGSSLVADGGMLLMGPHGGSDLPDRSWLEG